MSRRSIRSPSSPHDLDRALVERPPISLGDGDAIAPGCDAALDELRDLRDNGKSALAGIQQRERERTGITSLKVGYNKVFGYYLEVTHANSGAVPADYERRQTLSNAERYVTPELKEYEAKVLGAEERIVALEGTLFDALRGRVRRARSPGCSETARRARAARRAGVAGRDRDGRAVRASGGARGVRR